MFLALGLATLAAALPKHRARILSLVIQFNYVALDVNLFWAVLLAWYVIMGAGPFSLDRGLARGLSDSALPGAAAGADSFRWVTRNLGPPLKLALRLWVAVALLAGSGWEVFSKLGNAVLPLQTAVHFPYGVSLVCAPPAGARARDSLRGAAAHGGHRGRPHDGSLQTLYLYWLAVAALIALHGPGALSLDALIERWLRCFLTPAGKPAFSLEGLPRVVIVGAGFGGLTCAAEAAPHAGAGDPIDRRTPHPFQPLLYQAVLMALSPNDIAVPVRSLFREFATSGYCWGP